MKYRLSFASVELIAEHIAEIIIDEGTLMSLEMSEEFDRFLIEIFSGPFAILVNRINQFSFKYETSLQLGSIENRVATAVIVYDQHAESSVANLMKLRKAGNLNVKVFSAFDLGRRKSIEWLEGELANHSCST